MGPEPGREDDSMFLPGMEPDPNASPADRKNDAQEKTSTTNPPMSADANLNLTNARASQSSADAASTTHTITETAPAPAELQRTAPPPEYVEPLWMRRTKLVIFVMACIYLGIILIILPWNEAWTQNGLVHRYPVLRDLAMSNFTRGAITGLGFVNVWLGVWEAVHYREKK